MAATVTGTFRLIDRASRPMESMRREAERLDKALLSVGDHMDEVGTQKHIKQMEATEKAWRDVDRNVVNVGGGPGSSLGKTRTQMRGLDDDANRLSYRLGRLAAAFSGVQKILMALKLPVIVTGVAVLGQAIGALAGGVVALMPKLTDLLGVAGALPAALTGVGLAAITAKVALSGLGPALKGTKGAMASLTPQAREFVRTLKDLRPIGKDLQRSAQNGMLPGLTSAIESVSRKRPVNMARRVLKGMGETLGNTAAQAATAFTRPGFLRDFEGVAQQGEHLMSRFGSALINVAHALLDVAVAAEPFTSWMANTIQNWTVGWREAAKLNRRTGEMEDYFDRTRSALERFGSILGNLWDTFKGLGRAARPLGEDLWQSADKATERWAKFTNSVTGQARLRDYFNSLKEPIHAIFRLFGELGKAVMDLGASGGLTETAEKLTEAVDPLERAFRNLGENLGPAFAETIRELIKLFANLSEQGGAFAAVVRLMNGFLTVINALLEKIPGLSNLLTGVLGAVALQGLAARLTKVATSWGMVAASATEAAAAQRAAGASGMGSPGIFGPFGRGRGRGGTRAPTTAKTPYGEIPLPLGGIPGRGFGRTLLRRAGGFFGPVAALFAASDFISTEGDISQRAQAALSGATFGIIPRGQTDAEARAGAVADEQERIQHILHTVPENRAGIRQAIGRLKRRRASLAGDQGGGDVPVVGDDSLINVIFGDSHDDRGDTARMRDTTKTIAQLRQNLSGRDRTRGAEAALDFSSAFNIYAKKDNTRVAAETMLDPMSKRLQKFAREDAPNAARSFGSSMLRILAEAKRNNPKLKDEYDQLENSIERSFRKMGMSVEVVNGKIFTGSKQEWGKIQEAIGSQAERARERTQRAFTAMQQEAVGSLVAMGYDRATANKIVQGIEGGDKGAMRAAGADPLSGQVAPGRLDPHYTGGSGIPKRAQGPQRGARGMRVPGVGTHDNVHLGGGNIGAPGELLLNRHTERDVDRELLAMGRPTLGERVGSETRKHSDPEYLMGHRRRSRWGHARGNFRSIGSYGGTGVRGARGARLGGGIESVGQWAAGMGLSVGEGPGFGGVPSSGHAENSLHYSGLAYDVSGSPAAMMRFRRAAEQKYLGHGLNELFYDPFSYYIDEGHKVPGSIGDHSDHVHIGFFPGGPNGAGAVRGLLAGSAGSFKRVRARRSGLGGAPGAIADAAMRSQAAGLNRRLAQKAGLRGAPGIPRGLNFGGGHLGMAQLEQLARAAGMANPHLMAAIGMAESGGDPTVTNSIGARGLWQIIPSTASAFGLNYNRLTNPAYNAFGAAKILKEQGLGAWEAYTNGAYARYMARGGRIPSFAGWFGTGGSVTAHGPTLLGLGESGPETATITRGSSKKPGGGVRIEKVEIHNNRPGDIKKQLREEVDAAFRELSQDFDLDVDDTEVLT